MVAQAVRPAATGTPAGVGSRRGLARDPCPRAAFELGRRRKPAKFAPQRSVRPRSLQASRCAPRSRGRCSRRRHAGAGGAGSSAAPQTASRARTGARTWQAVRPGRSKGGNVRHQSSFGPGQRIAAAAARRLWHGSLSARVVDHHSWWLVSRVRISDTAKTWPLAVIGCRGLFLPDRLGSRAAMDPGLTWLNICSILICRT